MGNFFRIAGLGLIALGMIGMIALMLNVGINVEQYGVITTWGVIESTLILGLLFKILHLVTEMVL